MAVPGVSPAVRHRLFGSYLFTTQHTSGGVPALGAAKVLIATFTLIGGGVEPRQNLAANAFSRRRSPLAILFSARYGFSRGLLPKCLSAVSGAPRDATVRRCVLLGGALRIQRLEGSRPHGRLCTLNRFERVLRGQGQTELGRVRCLEGGMERRGGSPRPDVEAGESGMRGVLAG